MIDATVKRVAMALAAEAKQPVDIGWRAWTTYAKVAILEYERIKNEGLD